MSKKRSIVETHIVGRLEKDEMRLVNARRLLVGSTPMADFRVFVMDAKGRQRPTRAGFWFPPERLPQLNRLVDRLMVACEGDLEVEGRSEG